MATGNVDLERIKRKLRMMADASLDLRVPIKETGKYFRLSAAGQFRAQAGWAPLSDAYLNRWGGRSSGNDFGPLLVDTGAYRRSWTSAGKRGNISRINRDGGKFGSNFYGFSRNGRHVVNLTEIHQNGASYLGGNGSPPFRVPARPIDIGRMKVEDYAADRIVEHVMYPFKTGMNTKSRKVVE